MPAGTKNDAIQTSSRTATRTVNAVGNLNFFDGVSSAGLLRPVVQHLILGLVAGPGGDLADRVPGAGEADLRGPERIADHVRHPDQWILLQDQGKRAEAEIAHRDAVKIRGQLAQDFPAVPHYRQELAGSHNNLGFLLYDLGKPAEARPLWEKALQMAEGFKDTPTVDMARLMLGTPAAATPEEALMTAGLEALYTKADAEAAVPIFRKVLEQNPSHYGATFQLAMALDRAGKRADARPLWEKVIQMAEGYKDEPTVDMARPVTEPPRPARERGSAGQLRSAGLRAAAP